MSADDGRGIPPPGAAPQPERGIPFTFAEYLHNFIAPVVGVDSSVYKAFEAVGSRRAFIPAAFYTDAMADAANDNYVLPLGQLSSMSQPSLMADMLRRLELVEGERVLEVGTASGYNAALLSRLVGPSGHVDTIELNHDLVEHARSTLASFLDADEAPMYSNVTVHEGDGSLGLPGQEFDAIMVTAGSPFLPPALFAQLRIGGRIMIPIYRGDNPELPYLLQVITKTGADSGFSVFVESTGFVPLLSQTPGSGAWKMPDQPPVEPGDDTK